MHIINRSNIDTDLSLTATRSSHLVWGIRRARIGWFWYVQDWLAYRPNGWPVAQGWRPTKKWATRIAYAHRSQKPFYPPECAPESAFEAGIILGEDNESRSS